MPVYEYECTECGDHKELLQKISDPPLARCKKCKGKVKKLISQSTFHLKGSGWYVTDYASKSGGYDGKTGSGESTGKATESTKEIKGASDTDKKEKPSVASKEKTPPKK